MTSVFSGRQAPFKDADGAAGSDGPHPIDRHVGLRIRMRRKEVGVTQEGLAESLGLTFQQVQKYERAANRVSASKLWEIAQALETTVSYFYEGLGEAEHVRGEISAATPQAAQEFLLTAEGLELASLFPKVGRVRLRRKIVELVRAMVEAEGEQGSGRPDLKVFVS